MRVSDWLINGCGQSWENFGNVPLIRQTALTPVKKKKRKKKTNKHGFQISLTVAINRNINNTLIISIVKSQGESVVNKNKTWHTERDLQG